MPLALASTVAWRQTLKGTTLRALKLVIQRSRVFVAGATELCCHVLCLMHCGATLCASGMACTVISCAVLCCVSCVAQAASAPLLVPLQWG